MFKTCLLCKSSNLSPVLTLTHQPVVQNVYYPSKEQATSMKTTDLTIVECQNCHFIFNSSFDESLAHSEYDADYTYVPPRNALFKEHLELLTKKFVDDYNITNTEVADIGCGYPEFLELLAKEGNNACLGIDPSAPGEVPDKRVTLKRALFEGDFFGFNPKLVILRQVVEHVSDPIAFLSTIKDALSEGAYIYIEIPNIEQSFERKIPSRFLSRARGLLYKRYAAVPSGAHRIRDS
jgi:2-polyprenyl-3-methyl-5-hydroxy-6-metoxy-1,4-benzoquinol methylase